VPLLLSRASPFGNETGTLGSGVFEPGDAALERLRGSRVLVLGAGGLGCEILKGLALSGFRDVHVVDMDTIDLTNLNRQFLFRLADVGRYKAQVAADFINRRFAAAGVTVTPHVGRLQDEARFPRAWFRGFRLVLGGLDNLEARRYVNSLLCSFVETEGDVPGGAVKDFDAVIPFIDGGTEGFLGSVRVVLPKVTSCFECAMHTFPPPNSVAICTIASVPRKPEHCVLWALMIEWPKVMGEARAPDMDSPADVRWLTETAEARARSFGIEGVSYSFTLGVAKNIIPAIASTNAMIAAQTVLEALKLASFAAPSIDNVVGYGGSTEGCSCSMQALERQRDCIACMAPAVTLRGLDRATATLGDVVKNPRLAFKAPAVSVGHAEVGGALVPIAPRAARAPNRLGNFIYVPPPPPAAASASAAEAEGLARSAEDHKATEGNLARTLVDLGFDDGDDFVVVDLGAIAQPIEVTLHFA
jgi:ubiquitin-activating enzyme E1 C